MKIYKIYDNGGKTIDRYTVCFHKPRVGCLGLSSNPESPQGFSQWSEYVLPNETLGKEISFSDLPKNVQEHVKMRMKD